MDLVVATQNKGKIKEIQSILSGYNILDLASCKINIDVEETGTTFEENALLKAHAIAKIANKPTIADDSGLTVDYLGGEPGIYSARYAGENASDDDRIKKLLENMKNAQKGERGAAFVCVIALVYPDGRQYTFEGICRGEIAHSKAGENGFGYDPIFYVPEYGKTFAQISLETKNKISHRSIALKKLEQFLK